MKIHKFMCTLTAITLLVGTVGCAAESSETPSAKSDITNDSGIAAGVDKGEKATDKYSTSEKTAKSEIDTADSSGKADGDSVGNEAYDADGKDDGVTDVVGEGFAAEGDGDGDVRCGIEGDVNNNEPPEPGQLTAGEWNDNDNRGFFSNLVKSGNITFPSYGIDPRYRTMVTVTTDDGTPVVNAKSRLMDSSGNVLWSSVTDKQGRAYMFSSDKGVAASVEIESGGKKQSYKIENTKSDSQTSNITEDVELKLTFSAGSKTYKQTDIMFIVDSTGSMADEMFFLQSEFSAISSDIGTDGTRYSINFYRDEGDEYVTRRYDFTDDISNLQKNLNKESAVGGGDTPEAVAKILSETMIDGGWSDESVKIAFLIFDAPPHKGTENEILSAVKAASEKGIRIIPVVSSNGERDTEVFARSLAITTGGTYVFLTDDSGIGDSHLEPIIGDYKVEKLYDIIIRIIKNYKQ